METARNCRVMQVTNTGQDCGLQVKKEKRVVRSEGGRKRIPMAKEMRIIVFKGKGEKEEEGMRTIVCKKKEE